MARLIDVDVAIERAKQSDKIVRSSIWETGEVVEFLEDEPTVDAVEVVRCRDCWKSAEGLCSYNFKNVPGKDYCGDGERKDND